MKNEPFHQEYMENLRRAWQKRASQKREDLEKLRQDALIKAAAAAAHLKKNYKANAVYLYGSLAWGKHFSHRSDIDLFVEGFPKEENYWIMLVELEEISRPYEINVVLSEDATFSLREKVRNEGYPL
ncbi:MAG: nucleotidyltransferase family protein [Bacillota bacterium]